MTNAHTIVTEDYPENLHGGIMICGINFGYSQADEETELNDKYDPKEPKYFFLIDQFATIISGIAH